MASGQQEGFNRVNRAGELTEPGHCRLPVPKSGAARKVSARGSGRPFCLYHEDGQLVQAIKVQPDRGQRSSVGSSFRAPDRGSRRPADVAATQSLWIQ
jgi:hypothetical protein